MCGIAGFCLSIAEHDAIDSKALSIALLKEIEWRGKDATGAAWYEAETLIVQKDAMRARDFVHFLDMPTDVRNVILHTRAKTVGSEKNNDNNHPVITGNIVGVHNGGVWNDDALFKKMGIENLRIAEVDTEAIFAAIAYGGEINPDTEKPRLATKLTDRLEAIDGSAAIAWQEIEGDPSILHLARVYSSPLYWGQTAAGSFIFASTESHLKTACKDVGITLDYMTSMVEGTYLRVRQGVVEEYQNFESWSSSSSKYGSYGGSTYGKSSSGKTYVSTGSKSVVKVADDPKNKDTMATVKAAISSFAEAAKADAEFSPFLAHAGLAAHLSHALNANPLDRMEGDDYYEMYKAREENIESYMAELSGSSDEVTQTVAEMNGFLRPGDWVTTDISGSNGLYGQLYLLPQQFPFGGYLIRVLVPNSRYSGGYEPVLVERRFDEFLPCEWITPSVEAEVFEDQGDDDDTDDEPVGEVLTIEDFADHLASLHGDGSNY